MKKIFVGMTAFAACFGAGLQPAFAQTPVEDVVDVLPISDLGVELNDSPDPAVVDNAFTYKVSLRNGGTSDIDSAGLLGLFARDATLTVRTTLAQSVDPVAATPSEGGDCNDVTAATRVVTCRFDDLEGGLFSPGEFARVLITANPSAQGFVTATSRVSSPNLDLASASNEDREGTQVVPTCDGNVPTLVGDGGKDILRGTVKRDVILGLGGDDVIRAAAGRDAICAGDGNDRVRAHSGADRVFGQNGNDVIDGGSNSDYIEGNARNDRIDAGLGDDEVHGNVGADNISGVGGHDDLFGELGGDRLFGGLGNDFLHGGAAFDRCSGGPGSNTQVSCEG